MNSQLDSKQIKNQFLFYFQCCLNDFNLRPPDRWDPVIMLLKKHNLKQKGVGFYSVFSLSK